MRVLYPMKLHPFLLAVAAACVSASAFAQQPQTPAPKFSGFGARDGAQGASGNLIPNWNFSDPVPLKGWRVDFSYQDWYAKNVTYVKQVEMLGKKCAQIELPPGVAGNEGGKVETALVPVIPGATYRGEVWALLPKFASKVYCEVYAPDPRDEITRKDTESKGTKITIARIPEGDGHPPLVMIYRAQFPDPATGDKWVKVEKEFTVPPAGIIAGEQVKPTLMTLKGYTYGATQDAGKSYFTDFKLIKVKDPTPGSGVKVFH